MFEQYGVDRQWNASPTDAQPFYYRDLGGHATSVRLDSLWSTNFTTRTAVSYNNQSNPNHVAFDDRPSRPVYQSVFAAGAGLTGNGLLAVLDNYSQIAYTAPANKVTITVDAIYHQANLFGSHEVQVGAFLQPTRSFEANFHYPNQGFTLEEMVLKSASNPGGGFVPFHRRVYDSDAVTGISTNTRDFGGYVQDEWHPTQRLTVTGGVRIDRIERKDRIFGDTLLSTTAIGPRVGVNYAVTSDRRNMIRATAGVIHDATSNGTQSTAGTNSGGYVDSYDTNLDGVFETTLRTSAVNQRTLNRIIDLANYRQPHTVDITAGYARQLPGRITLDISAVRREFKDRSTTIDTNGVYNGNVFVGYADPNFTDIVRLTSNTYNWPVYSALAVQAARDGNGWQFVADYTRQFRHLAGTWQPRDPASFIQPDAFPNDKGIGGVSASTTNSLTGTAYTGAGQWQDHVFRAAMSVNGPWGTLAATSYTWQSGPWSGPIMTKLAAGDPQFGPSSVVLSNGKTVSNPLATPIRFAYANAGEGQFHLPAVGVWNLKLGRRFSFGHLRVDASAEVLNLINSGNDYIFANGANQLYSPLYGKTGGLLQTPRSVQGSVRLDF
jgi:hypothetical protein